MASCWATSGGAPGGTGCRAGKSRRASTAARLEAGSIPIAEPAPPVEERPPPSALGLAGISGARGGGALRTTGCGAMPGDVAGPPGGEAGIEAPERARARAAKANEEALCTNVCLHVGGRRMWWRCSLPSRTRSNRGGRPRRQADGGELLEQRSQQLGDALLHAPFLLCEACAHGRLHGSRRCAAKRGKTDVRA